MHNLFAIVEFKCKSLINEFLIELSVIVVNFFLSAGQPVLKHVLSKKYK